MTDRETLAVQILMVIHQNAMTGNRVFNIQAGNIRIIEVTPEYVDTNPPEIGINVTGNFIRSVAKVISEGSCSRLTMRLQ